MVAKNHFLFKKYSKYNKIYVWKEEKKMGRSFFIVMFMFMIGSFLFFNQVHSQTVNCLGNGLPNPSTNSTTCSCFHGYVSHKCQSGEGCCYKQEKRVKMFLLAFFVSWTGAPYFVLGQTGLGIGILILCFSSCFSVCYIACFLASKSDRTDDSTFMCFACLIKLATLAGLVWCLATWIMFAAETEPWNDKHGVPVAGW